MILADVVIVLCRAADSGNVGAVCRVMKNMGLSRLRLVQPASFDEEKLLVRAVHAGDIWQKAEFFDSLPTAVADCSFVAGTTRRRGRNRKTSMEPRALISLLQERSGAAALVFGNERTGLTREELECCNIASHIPVSGDFPSLNLSHAVQIFAYELFLAFGCAVDKPVKGERIPLEIAAVEKLCGEITETLADIGFYRQPGREEQFRFLRDMICRAGLSEREARYLKEIFIKTAHLGGVANR